jgi:hypothetical protein
VSAVTIIIERIAAVCDGINPVDIVYIAIAVIVNTVAWDLIWVAPHICRDIWVPVIYPCVDHECDHI